MTREVHLQQATTRYSLAASGPNTLVHQERSITITVSVKCHSGRNLGNGTLGGCHPKILHILPEAVSYHLLYSYRSHLVSSICICINVYLSMLGNEKN